MDRYKAGMLARSLAGHDTGKMYVIMESENYRDTVLQIPVLDDFRNT